MRTLLWLGFVLFLVIMTLLWFVWSTTQQGRHSDAQLQALTDRVEDVVQQPVPAADPAAGGFNLDAVKADLERMDRERDNLARQAYEKCVLEGGTVQESLPEVCTLNGTSFTNVVAEQDATPEGDVSAATPETQVDTTATPTTQNNTNTYAAPAQPRTGSWQLLHVYDKKWDIDDEDDDVDRIKYEGNPCKDVRGTAGLVHCAESTQLNSKSDAAGLAGACAPSACRVGTSCMIWGDDEKDDKSRKLYVASYGCQ